MMRGRASLALFAAIAIAARADAQATTFQADDLPFLAPSSFCAVDRSGGGHHAQFWQGFQPPSDGSVRMLALGLDCATLELGRLQRPRALLQVMELRRPPELRQATRREALDLLEARYRKPQVASKTPVLRRDDLAIYLEQKGPGVTAFTFTGDGRFLTVTILQFAGDKSAADILADVVPVIESLDRPKG